MPDWAREYFERGYGQRWGLKAPSDHVRLEVDGLYRLLHLSSSSRVIDVACGHGRHAVALAERGVDVIGLDFAVALLTRARDLSTDLRARVRLVRGDMRRLPFLSECADAVIVMDAFGFFETNDEHDAILREAVRVLTPGGRLGPQPGRLRRPPQPAAPVPARRRGRQRRPERLRRGPDPRTGAARERRRRRRPGPVVQRYTRRGRRPRARLPDRVPPGLPRCAERLRPGVPRARDRRARLLTRPRTDA